MKKHKCSQVCFKGYIFNFQVFEPKWNCHCIAAAVQEIVLRFPNVFFNWKVQSAILLCNFKILNLKNWHFWRKIGIFGTLFWASFYFYKSEETFYNFWDHSSQKQRFLALINPATNYELTVTCTLNLILTGNLNEKPFLYLIYKPGATVNLQKVTHYKVPTYINSTNHDCAKNLVNRKISTCQHVSANHSKKLQLLNNQKHLLYVYYKSFLNNWTFGPKMHDCSKCNWSTNVSKKVMFLFLLIFKTIVLKILTRFYKP
jgi:hypothetical protein